jgi:flagellum-specific peptidoglycan hydrolase FlgJ
MDNKEFIRAAIAAASRSTYPAGITVAQAALESAWGSSQLSQKANNYFGVKAHGEAEAIELLTTEVVNGKTVKVLARFAAYPNMAACFADRDRIINQLACYQDARANASDPELFTRCVARHWATDPKYAEKLLKIYRDNKLDALDHHS